MISDMIGSSLDGVFCARGAQKSNQHLGLSDASPSARSSRSQARRRAQ